MRGYRVDFGLHCGLVIRTPGSPQALKCSLTSVIPFLVEISARASDMIVPPALIFLYHLTSIARCVHVVESTSGTGGR